MLRHDRVVWLHKTERKDLKATNPAGLKRVKFPWGQNILTDATRHKTRKEKGHPLSSFLQKLQKVSEINSPKYKASI